MGQLDEVKYELVKLGKLDELKDGLCKLDEMQGELDELLSWRMSWVSWMS